MFRFDRTLIQPSLATLEQTLREAAAAADLPGSGKLLRWPVPELAAFLAAWRANREGCWQWDGGAGAIAAPREHTPLRRGRGHAREPRPAPLPQPRRNHEQRASERRSAVAVVWWSDCIGRRHTRIIGCQRQAVEPPEQLLKPSATHPAVAQVYPDHAFRLTRAGQTRALVACACGVFGSAEEVGWMGDSCGPCHDGREAGEALPAQPPRQFSVGRAVVHALAFSGDGRVLAATTLDGMLRVRDVRGGRERLAVSLDGNGCFCRVRLSPDGTSVAARARHLGAICVWDLATGASREIEVEPAVSRFEYLADGRLALLAPGEARVWCPKTGRVEATFPLGEGFSNAETVAADGTLLAIALHGGEGAVYDVLGRRERRKLRWPDPGVPALAEEAASGGVSQGELAGPVVAASPGGRLLAVQAGGMFSLDGVLALMDATSGEVWPVARGEFTSDATFTADGRTLLGLDVREKALRAWDVATGAERLALRDTAKGFFAVAASPCGRLVATGDYEGRVKLWPAELLGDPGERGT